jgi:hypothetical protein
MWLLIQRILAGIRRNLMRLRGNAAGHADDAREVPRVRKRASRVGARS